MIELFCILSMLFVIGFFVFEATKGVGRKISRLTTPNSDVIGTGTCHHYGFQLNMN